MRRRSVMGMRQMGQSPTTWAQPSQTQRWPQPKAMTRGLSRQTMHSEAWSGLAWRGDFCVPAPCGGPAREEITDAMAPPFLLQS